MKKLVIVGILANLIALAACSQSADEDVVVDDTVVANAADQIDVTFDNYNQAETARNFNNWAKRGGNNQMLHEKELSPIGPDAPTIRMNLDTLYSIGVYDNDGSMAITIPNSELYQSAMVIDTDGYTPFFYTEPGTYEIEHPSEALIIILRTAIKDRHSDASFEEAYAAQEGVAVEGNGPNQYEMPAYDQHQLHALTIEYNKAFLDAGILFTYGDGTTPVNEEHRTWSNSAGWGGMVTETGRSNVYVSSKNLPGDQCMAVTFPDTGDAFFTSFTIYDTNGYLVEGNTHINSYTWKTAEDGSTTIHFNCGNGAVNNIPSNGAEYNYLVRHYGASQAVIDGDIKPIVPTPVN